MSENELPDFRIVQKDGELRVRRKKRLSFGDLYHDLLRVRWPAFLALFTAAFFTLNCFFGLLYDLLPNDQFTGYLYDDGFRRYLESFFFSVQTFGTIGYGKISPVGMGSNAVVTLECYTSLFIAAVLTGLVFARFARPHAKVIFTKNAVVREYDGVPSLMFRVANERQNYINEARVSVYFVHDDVKTGFRNFEQLKLEKNTSPVFALSWTISHDIDELSPLFKIPPKDWEAVHGELIVTFTGMDTTLSQQVHAKSSYLGKEILYGHDFHDVIHRNQDGTVELLLEHFDSVKSCGTAIAP